MKWTREIGQKIGKLYLTNEKMTEGLIKLVQKDLNERLEVI